MINFDDNLLAEVFSYLDKSDLETCAQVNTRFKNLTNHEGFYPRDIPFINKYNVAKKKYLGREKKYLAKVAEQTSNTKKINDLKSPIANKKTEISNRTVSWFGYFVSVINKTEGLLSRIKNLLIRIFQSIANEVSIQNKLNQEFAVLSEQEANLVTTSKTLGKEVDNLKILFNSSKDTYDILEITYQGLQRAKKADDKMMALFGGREEFERLPVLDIGDKMGKTDYIDFIKPSDMTDPIMRGKDKYGREFFSIRAKINGEQQQVQTFFQRHLKEGTWSDGGDIIINGSGPIIEKGKVDFRAQNELENLIQNGEADLFRKGCMINDQEYTLHYFLC